jgi:hypothetical protein
MIVSIIIFADEIKICPWTDWGNDVISFKVKVRRPGESFAGRPYEYWRQLGQQLGPGRHEVPDADEHGTVYLDTPSQDEIEEIRRAEKNSLTLADFENAPMPDRPVIDRLPEDWHRPGPGRHEVADEGSTQ